MRLSARSLHVVHGTVARVIPASNGPTNYATVPTTSHSEILGEVPFAVILVVGRPGGPMLTTRL